MYKSNEKLSILHIILAIRETSAAYNEHCLPWAEKRDLSICTYFRSETTPPDNVTVFEGNGSLRGFYQALKTALDTKDYDIIHAHSPHVGLLFLFTTLLSYLKFAPSTVVTVHDSYQNYKLRNQLMYLPVFASFQRIICCSKSSYDSFPPIYKLLAGNRLCYVQNGLDIARVDRVAVSARQLDNHNNTRDFKIVAISRLVDIKNPFSVLTAYHRSADKTTKLIYMGDGPLRNSLIARGREVGLEHQIEFTGLIPRDVVFENLLNADIFISASRGEGLPVAVLEAMACRCAVILSDIPPHREIVGNVDFIPLIKPEDATGFAREIKRYKEMSISGRKAIGQRCRKLVKEKFSLSAMHAGYSEIYAQITSNQVPFVLDQFN